MKVDVKEMSERLAYDPAFSDYDFWRALKSLDDELFRIEYERRPVPMELVFARAILRRARNARGEG
ncbi:hypothetical protein [Nitratireductor thuwali]|uniref:Uncharacterized protein n=1 Tax=Nitratireductor thuwali TaxID=2267699 RepID=A0ABY5MDI3_9HYPH|nr:hypothetical protein NTH_00556 [Nitratireductor thuwali]